MKTKEDIKIALQLIFDDINTYLKNVDSSSFKKSKNGKWSIAQNIDHLTLSNSITTIGLSMPIFALNTLYKKPTRNAWNYDEVVWQYQLKLNSGAKAPLPFTPKLSIVPIRSILERNWKNSFKRLLSNLDKWTDSDLDTAYISHPLLGVLSVRELMYFTVYHNRHHFETIQSLV